MDGINFEVKTPSTPKKYNVNFWLLAFGRVISGLSNAIFGFGIGLYVLDLTGSAVAFSVTLSMSIIPSVIVNILAGVFVDKHNKKRIMVTSDILCGITVFVFFLLFLMNLKSIVLIWAYTLILSVIQAFFSLAINSSIPDFVDKDNVARVNSTFQAAGALISIVGPIIGALTYKIIGIKMIFLINSIGFLAAGAAEVFLTYEYFNATAFGLAEKKSYIQDIKVTFSYLNQNRILAFFFILATVINFFYNPLIFIVLPFVTYNIMKITGFQLSLMQASVAIGVILTSFIILFKKGISKKLLSKFFALFMMQAVLIILWAFPVLPFFNAGNKWSVTIVFCFILILYGAMNTAQNIPVFTYFQLRVPDEIRARVIGVFTSAMFITTPLGLWLYGIMLEKVNWAYITTLSGVLLFVISIIAPRNKYYKEFLELQKDQPKESEG